MENYHSNLIASASNMAQGIINRHLGDKYSVNGNSSVTLHFDPASVMIVAISRRNQNTRAMILTDYWSDGYNIIGDSSFGNVTITKAANSADITITNGNDTAIGVLAI